MCASSVSRADRTDRGLQCRRRARQDRHVAIWHDAGQRGTPVRGVRRDNARTRFRSAQRPEHRGHFSGGAPGRVGRRAGHDRTRCAMRVCSARRRTRRPTRPLTIGSSPSPADRSKRRPPVPHSPAQSRSSSATFSAVLGLSRPDSPVAVLRRRPSDLNPHGMPSAVRLEGSSEISRVGRLAGSSSGPSLSTPKTLNLRAERCDVLQAGAPRPPDGAQTVRPALATCAAPDQPGAGVLTERKW